eukprot:1016703-Rhodomonas_salina.1
MVSQSSLWMVDHMGSSWTDWQKMGYADADAHAEAVFEEQADWLLHAQRDFLTRLIKALFGYDTKAVQMPYIDTLLPIVLSTENLQLISGTYYSSTWFSTPESQPVIKTWACLLFRFEGIVDPQAFNMPADFNTAYLIATGTTGQNIRQLDSTIEEHHTEITKLYKDLPSFLLAL